MKTLIILLVLASTSAMADSYIKWSIRTPDGHTVIVDYNMTDETMNRFVEWVWVKYPQTAMDPDTGEDTGVALERTPENIQSALIDWGLEQYGDVRTDVFSWEAEVAGIKPMPPTFAPISEAVE